MSKRSRQLSNDTAKKKLYNIYYMYILQAFSEKNATRQIFRAERLSGHKYHDHVLMFCEPRKQVDSDANNNVMCCEI